MIWASNRRATFDQIFARRLQRMILLPMPHAKARHELWRRRFEKDRSAIALGDDDNDLDKIAATTRCRAARPSTYRHAGIQTVKSGGNKVGLRDMAEGLRREVRKDGRIAAG